MLDIAEEFRVTGSMDTDLADVDLENLLGGGSGQDTMRMGWRMVTSMVGLAIERPERIRKSLITAYFFFLMAVHITVNLKENIHHVDFIYYLNQVASS